LRHQLGSRSLRLEQGSDAQRLAPRTAGYQTIRQVLVCEIPALGGFNRVLLNQQPTIPALLESLDVLEQSVRVVRESHLRRRKALHASERLPAEDRGEVMLPSLNVKLDIRDWGRGNDGVAPHRAQPLDVSLVGGVTGDPLEIVK